MNTLRIGAFLNNPLYSYSVNGARGVLLNIAGEKDLSLAEVNSISKTISDLVHSEAKIIFGISQKKKYSGVIKTTVLAAGCPAKIFFSKKKKSKPKKKKVEPKKVEVNVEERKKEEPKKKKIKKVVKKKPVKKVVAPRPRVDMKKRASALKALEKEMSSKVRKNALQIKKEIEEEEKEMLEQEKRWEMPAFLRKNIAQDNSK